MKKILLSIFLFGCLSFIANAENRIVLEGVAVSNFKVKSANTQMIVLYINDKPCYFRITPIPFAVFEKVECYPSDVFRAEVISVHYNTSVKEKDVVQLDRDSVIRFSKKVSASQRNKHGFITLQPLNKSDMETVH